MKKYPFLTAVLSMYFFFISFAVFAVDSDTSHLTLLFAGDIMGHDSQINSAYYPADSVYNYDPCFKYVKPIIEKADIAFGNLEVTFGGPPYKGYPQFSSPDELGKALKNAGFDILITANNHVLDRKSNGLERTISILDQQGFIYTGSFENTAARDSRYPLLVEKNGILLAILNYTYGSNGLKADTPNIVNYIDTSFIRQDLEKVLKVNPDFIIACLHWGREYERNEHEDQRKLAEFLLNSGVDVIIGSHPHVVQPVRKYYTTGDSTAYKLVVYSLGNFMSNQRERYRDGGIMIELTLSKADNTRLENFNYLPVWVHKPFIGEKQVFQMIPANLPKSRLDSLVFSDTEYAQLLQFYNDTRTHLNNVPENRLFLDH